MANIHKTLMVDLDKKGISITFYDDMGITTAEHATSAIIDSVDPTFQPITTKLPTKKIIDEKWVMGRITKRDMQTETTNKQKNLYADILDAICDKLGVRFIETVFPRTYGFGSTTSHNQKHMRIVSELLKFLNNGDVEYEIVESEALNITQIRISQTKENRDVLIKATKRLIKNIKK